VTSDVGHQSASNGTSSVAASPIFKKKIQTAPNLKVERRHLNFTLQPMRSENEPAEQDE
jgi:hypothetical protein